MFEPPRVLAFTIASLATLAVSPALAGTLVAIEGASSYCPEPRLFVRAGQTSEEGPTKYEKQELDQALEPKYLEVESKYALEKHDGSLSDPYPSIGSALLAAEVRGLEQVCLDLADGTYVEDVIVTIPTHILGTTRSQTRIVGTITNATDATLHLVDLTLADAPAPGAIVVAHASAQTRLESVTIQRATHYGILHAGGYLLATDVLVTGTRAGAGDRSEGAGIFATDGAVVDLYDSTLQDNASQAFAIAGAGSLARLVGIEVTGTGTNPYFSLPARYEAGLGAVEARDGATLLVRDALVSHNDFLGVHVGSGAEARLEHITVAATQELPTAGGPLGGSNIVVARATLELSEFLSDEADLAGLQVIASAVAARDGTVWRSGFGIAFSDMSGFEDSYRCLDRVVVAASVYDDYSFGTGPLPIPAFDPPPPRCASVPWR